MSDVLEPPPSAKTAARGVTANLRSPNVALAVGAHPDDIEFGCGGTLAKWAAAGCRVHLAVLTDGSKGTWDPEQDESELVRIRQEEQRAAARVLGATDVTFFGHRDGELQNGEPERRQVVELIRSLQPDVLLGHDPWRRYRLHPDHRHAGFIVTDGVVAARDPLFYPGLLAAHRPAELLLWEADEPDHDEEIGEGFDRKLAALLTHHSQFRSTMGISGDPGQKDGDIEGFEVRVRRFAIQNGERSGMALAESFRRLAP
jgi:LmbE family N-acetylglucosaminyl deacetylase